MLSKCVVCCYTYVLQIFRLTWLLDLENSGATSYASFAIYLTIDINKLYIIKSAYTYITFVSFALRTVDFETTRQLCEEKMLRKL